MSTETKSRSARLRKTCFPLSGRKLCEQRALTAWMLHMAGMTRPLSHREIRQVLNLSGPDVARRLVAKGRRLIAGRGLDAKGGKP